MIQIFILPCSVLVLSVHNTHVICITSAVLRLSGSISPTLTSVLGRQLGTVTVPSRSAFTQHTDNKKDKPQLRSVIELIRWIIILSLSILNLILLLLAELVLFYNFYMPCLDLFKSCFNVE